MIRDRADLPPAGFIPEHFATAPSITGIEEDPGGDESVTAQTLAVMARLVRAECSDPSVQAATAEALSALPPNASDEDKASAIFWWVKSHVLFVDDSRQEAPFHFRFDPNQFLISPAALLSMDRPAGECPVFSMLTAAMLSAADIRSSFKTVAAAPSSPDTYSHVYVLAHLAGGEPFPLDTSHGPAPGFEVKPVFKARIWPIQGKKPMLRIVPKRRAARHIGEIDWSAILQTSIDSGAKIAEGVLIPRYGNPGPGTMRVDTADGGRSISTYPGGGLTSSLNLGGGSSNTLLLIGAVVVGALVLSSAMSRN